MIPEQKPFTLLFNPFFYIAGAKALGFGLAVIFLAGLIGCAAHTHFDGVLDTHTGAGGPVWFFLAEGVTDWFCLGAVLWLFGKLISKTAFRTIDVFGTQALARWPTLFIALLTLAPGYQRFTHELIRQVTQSGVNLDVSKLLGLDAAVFFTVALLMLPLVVWMVALVYNAYSLSCNVRGGKAVGTFIAGLLLAEILSKIAITGLMFLR